MRESFIQAISIADQPTKKPIDSYWLCADQFQVILMDSAWQVTRLIVTPDSPFNPPVDKDAPLQPIYYVTPGNAGEVNVPPNPVDHERPGTDFIDQVDVVQVKHW